MKVFNENSYKESIYHQYFFIVNISNTCFISKLSGDSFEQTEAEVTSDTHNLTKV